MPGDLPIVYDPDLRPRAGFIELDTTNLGDPTAGRTLLSAIYYFVYTQEGRSFMDSLTLDAHGNLPQASRDALVERLATRFNVTDPPIVFAFVEAHVAALRWKLANGAANDGERKTQQRVYQQYTSFLTWCLWEDAQGREFSLIW